MPTMSPSDAAELFRAEPDRYVDVGDAEVACRSIGTGPDVLFVHGWPVSGATFRTLLPHLVEHATCHVLDLAGAGSSRFTAESPLSIEHHIESVRRVVEELGLDQVAVVGHDSGGMIARHALAGDERLRSMGLVNTEQPQGLSWRFRLFLAPRRVPGFGAALGWLAAKPRLRRNRFVLGDAFADASFLDGEFDEFFLKPLHEVPERLDAAMRILRSFDHAHVTDLAALHRRIGVPVQLVWGDQDPFFPLDRAEGMVATFPDARLEIIRGAGLFAHEERPAEVAAALLPVLVG
jgi:pimeloyl-ACP methyl ester carboxylesterase